jgi:hypothetical protein
MHYDQMLMSKWQEGKKPRIFAFLPYFAFFVSYCISMKEAEFSSPHWIL